MFWRQLSTSCREFRKCSLLSCILGDSISLFAVDTILGIAGEREEGEMMKNSKRYNIWGDRTFIQPCYCVGECCLVGVVRSP